MPFLQLTIPTFELPTHLDQQTERQPLPLPACPADLPLYCRYCGRDAVACDDQDVALCADCYQTTAHVCGDCGEVYVGTGCEDCQACCENCNEVIPNAEARTNDDGEHFCDDCYCELYSICEHCDCEVAVNDIRCENDSCYCARCFDDNFTTCDDCGEAVANEDFACRDRSQTICNSCYEDHYFTCERCENICHCDNYAEDGCCCDCDTSGDFEAIAFRPRENTYGRTGSARCFGIELETSECDDFHNLDGEVCFSSKEDGSISGKEFVSEVLCGDAGLAEVEKFCDRAEELGFSVNSTCGYHLHIGVSDLTEAQLVSVSTAYNLTYELWSTFVSESRRNNGYCKRNSWDIQSHSDFARFADFARAQDRYQWFNIRSYCKHSTFEIRLHSGTLNASKVCNWIIAHLRFVDAVAKLSPEEVKRIFAIPSPADMFAACLVFWPADVTEYLAQRAAKFGTQLTARELASAV